MPTQKRQIFSTVMIWISPFLCSRMKCIQNTNFTRQPRCYHMARKIFFLFSFRWHFLTFPKRWSLCLACYLGVKSWKIYDNPFTGCRAVRSLLASPINRTKEARWQRVAPPEPPPEVASCSTASSEWHHISLL